MARKRLKTELSASVVVSKVVHGQVHTQTQSLPQPEDARKDAKPSKHNGKSKEKTKANLQATAKTKAVASADLLVQMPVVVRTRQVFHALLAKVDILRNRIQFDELQVLGLRKCYFFCHRRAPQLDQLANVEPKDLRGAYEDVEQAVADFKKCFQAEMAVAWEKRFEVQPKGSKTYIALDYSNWIAEGRTTFSKCKRKREQVDKEDVEENGRGDEDECKCHEQPCGQTSGLSMCQQVVELLQLISDDSTPIQPQGSILVNPLGVALASHTLDRCVSILGKLYESILRSSRVSPTRFQELSSQFYALVPHRFDGLPLNSFVLDSSQLIHRKVLQVEQVFGIPVYTRLMAANPRIRITKLPLELAYENLQCKLSRLPETSPLFHQIVKYLTKTTRSAGPNQVIVFTVSKKSEVKRFAPYKNSENRQLLWHGSAPMNFRGILTEGLRIQPPGVTFHGSSYGKGIYFSAQASMALSFCSRPDMAPSKKVLLLNEVALGASYPVHDDHAVNKRVSTLPSGYDSTAKTCRCRCRNATMDDGVIIPMRSCSCFDSIYVVYNPAQTRMRFLVVVDHHWT